MATSPSSLQPPPLLLTKRLTSFLRANLSAQLTSALLLTPTGKILSYACSPAAQLPVSVLRTQATVASSLWAIHAGRAGRRAVDAALGGGSSSSSASPPGEPDNGGGGGGNENGRAATREASGGYDGPSAVTIQLESGNVVVMRRLRCGMLFVCFGPVDAQGDQHQHPAPETNGHGHSHLPPAAAAPPASNHHAAPAGSTPPIGSPSEAASVLSVATGVATVGSAATATTTASSAGAAAAAATAAVVAMRRHVEELARWLDDRLGMLSMPEEGIGV
ncbi:hypothetical protein NKR23_g10971 [Pleurostoma richardsiae]|uniref:Uncharacterized protein n=1 Tax=Pleurostoma richardsiae TaxID=41990 RepID=A0AA38RIL5_9PEZI|nr:hypothetical protein NKR23_g10971 [Pleurostoma richardsiae]